MQDEEVCSIASAMIKTMSSYKIEEADVTVVEVEAVDVTKTSTNKPSPQ